MDLQIKNKWISVGGSSVIQDIQGNDLLFVKGKIFSFTAKKFINDLQGNTHYIVRNKFWRLFQRKAFVLSPENEVVATVRRKIFSVHDHYFVTSNLGDLQN